MEITIEEEKQMMVKLLFRLNEVARRLPESELGYLIGYGQALADKKENEN